MISFDQYVLPKIRGLKASIVQQGVTVQYLRLNNLASDSKEAIPLTLTNEKQVSIDTTIT
jgi:hypothetical protein